jgi:hypothetical protein
MAVVQEEGACLVEVADIVLLVVCLLFLGAVILASLQKINYCERMRDDDHDK